MLGKEQSDRPRHEYCLAVFGQIYDVAQSKGVSKLLAVKCEQSVKPGISYGLFGCIASIFCLVRSSLDL